MSRGRILSGCLSVLLLGLVAMPASADSTIRFERLSMADGLSQSSINAIAQDEQGYLWIGTQYGLNRYDGYRFDSYRHEPEIPASLSNSAITDLHLSASGKLWVATRDGLNRLDPESGRAERFFPPAAANDGRPWASGSIVAEDDAGRLFLAFGPGHLAYWCPQAREIQPLSFSAPVADEELSQRSAIIDNDGRFWVFNAAGLWRLDAEARRLEPMLPLDHDPVGRLSEALALGPDGRLLLAADEGLKIVEPGTLEVIERIRPTDHGHDSDRIDAVLTDADGMVWLVLTQSLVRFDPRSGAWKEMFDGGLEAPLGSGRQEIRLANHGSGDVWFASQYGVARWRGDSGAIEVLRHDPRDDRSIPPTTLNAGYILFTDDEDNVWVGSRLGGLARYSPLSQRFEHIEDRSALGDIPFAGHNIVRGIAEQRIDDREYVWLALDSAGLRRVRRRDNGGHAWVDSFHAEAAAGQRLPGNRLWSVVTDPGSDLVWVLESYHLIAIDGRAGRVVSVVPLDDSGGRATDLLMSRDGSALWVGHRDGVTEFHVPVENRHRIERCPRSPLLAGETVFNLLELDDGRVLAAARQGVGLADFHGGRGEFFVDAGQATGRVRQDFFGLANHSEDGFWVGAAESGLAHLRFTRDEQGRKIPEFEWYGQDDGLVDETIYAILPDAEGWLWLSSNSGLMRWQPETREVRHFTPADGIQHFEFNNTIAHIGPSGRFYFGGINGANAFFPDSVAILEDPPRLYLQRLYINGQEMSLPAGQPPVLELAHDQSDLEVEFVGLHLAAPRRVRYQLRLTGLDEGWIEAGARRRVRYAGLPPGDYAFDLRAANSDGVWSEPERLLKASVARPPWQTGPAYVTYALAGLGLLGLVWALNGRRRRLLESQVRERTAELSRQQQLIGHQAAELERALEARTVFLTNVSHEFRTPLTLIQASLDRLAQTSDDEQSVELGRRYVRRLLRLVDQLLDLSRLRVERESAFGEPWSLAPVINVTVEAFRNLAEARGITLATRIEPGWRTRCSQEHVEKILLNLLTNALKFCPRDGRVTVGLAGGENGVSLIVSDTGPGIAAADQELIFERFHRTEAAERGGISGAGVGLALVREAARAMDGEVHLESEPGRGSVFRVDLPADYDPVGDRPVALISGERLELDTALLRPDPVADLQSPAAPAPSERRGSVLVVEDNADLRHYLHQLLAEEWEVIEAGDGRQALRIAARRQPDLIVSDIMMPEMDGLELLQRLREEFSTSHIPVMLLTARQDHATRLKGLTLSADDFLAKPFDARELRARLQRMIDNRERFRQRLLARGAIEAEPETDDDRPLVPRDRALLENLDRWLGAHATDPAIDVDAVSDAMALQRRTLQRKLKALTGLTPAAYIREYRLARACRQLVESRDSVNEIALSCGFSSPQQFHRAFRRKHGVPPDQWRRQQTGGSV